MTSKESPDLSFHLNNRHATALDAKRNNESIGMGNRISGVSNFNHFDMFNVDYMS